MSVLNASELRSGMIDCTNIGIYDLSLSADGLWFIVKVYEKSDLVYKMKHDTYSGAKHDYLKTIKELHDQGKLN